MKETKKRDNTMHFVISEQDDKLIVTLPFPHSGMKVKVINKTNRQLVVV